MSPESSYIDIYKKFRHLKTDEIQKRLVDMQDEMATLGNRIGSAGFILLNDSSNNLNYSVLH